jgi:hypothetical protein
MAIGGLRRLHAPSGNPLSTPASQAGYVLTLDDEGHGWKIHRRGFAAVATRRTFRFSHLFGWMVAPTILVGGSAFADEPESTLAVDLEEYVRALVIEQDNAPASPLATLGGRFPVKWDKEGPKTVAGGDKKLSVYGSGSGFVRLNGALSMVRDSPESRPAVWEFFFWTGEGLPSMASVADFKCTQRLDSDPCSFDAQSVLSASGLPHELVCHQDVGNQRTWVFRVVPARSGTVFIAQTQGYLNAIHVVWSSLPGQIEQLFGCPQYSHETGVAAGWLSRHQRVAGRALHESIVSDRRG